MRFFLDQRAIAAFDDLVGLHIDVLSIIGPTSQLSRQILFAGAFTILGEPLPTPLDIFRSSGVPVYHAKLAQLCRGWSKLPVVIIGTGSQEH